MDKKYQDLSIFDKHFRTQKLVIPRGCHIISIFFDDDAVRVHYVNSHGFYFITNIAYEELKMNKLIID